MAQSLRTIGLLGGMTYHSTILYYSMVNAHVQHVRGGQNAASLVMHSFNFAEMAGLFKNNEWQKVTGKFVDAAKNMKAAGARGIVIGCNIGHKVAREVEHGVGLPVLHIVTPTADALRRRGIKRIAFLATGTAMREDFIHGQLSAQAGVEVLLPSDSDINAIDSIIFKELSVGKVTHDTKELFSRVIGELLSKGAEGVVLACTDLQFVVSPEDVSAPVFDTLELHAKWLAEWSMREEE
jgi:aspartate racemase